MTAAEDSRMDRKELGFAGEQAACDYLRRCQYEIVAQNVRTPFGEIDLLARHRGQLVVVEVKTRRGSGFGSPFEGITPRQQQRLRRAGVSYARSVDWNGPLRFDAIGVLVGAKMRVEHLKGVF